MKKELDQIFKKFSSLEIRKKEKLAPYTTYGIGGEADYFVLPDSVSQLSSLLTILNKSGVPVFVIGKGSNILVSDKGFRGVVISLEKCSGDLFLRSNNQILADAGLRLSDLVDFAEEHEIKGFDFLAGIPGTVGGALIMNAGAFGGEIGEKVQSVQVLNSLGEIEELFPATINFGYRSAPGFQDKIILSALLEGEWTPGKGEILKINKQEYLKKRKMKQPLEYGSCGSVFKRPPGNYAGTLIELAGCKGMSEGDAEVSFKHANFIINKGNAAAEDVFKLIVKVRHKVYKMFGIELQTEVKFIGEFPQLPDPDTEVYNE